MYVIQSLLYVPIILALIFIGGLAIVRRKAAGVAAFAVSTFVIALWISWQALAQLNVNPTVNLITIRLSIATSIFITYFMLLFFRGFSNRSTSKFWELVLAIPCIALAIISLTSLGVNSVEVTALGISVNDSPVSYLILLGVLAVYSVVGLATLIINTVKKPKEERFTNYLIFIGFAQLVVINLVVLFTLSRNAAAQYLIVLPVLVMVVIIAFAIIRHRLFDIRLVAVRAVTYSLTILLIGAIYGFVAFAVIGSVFGNISGTTKQVLDTILAVVLAFTFQPIRRFFEKISTSIFYRGHYDTQVLLNQVGRVLASDIDLDKISNRLIQLLTKQMKIDKAEIVIFGAHQLFYENDVFTRQGVQIPEQALKKLGRVLVVADDQPAGDRKELMQTYGINVSLALRTSEKFIGYLLLGEKKSGDIYGDEDLRVLRIIAQELSVAAANALSYKEIQLFSETLAEKVRERTGQLRHANDQLKELDKAKDEFISMASHQLRTPLTTVKGYASMLEEGDFGKLTTEQKQTVELTLDGANRMARLIDDLLNVSRMDANRFFLEGDKVDLGKVLPEELTQLNNLAESKKVKLSYTEPKSKIPIITLDENKTRQVIMNIVDNAIHYSQPPSGGGQVQISLKLVGQEVVFEVRDNGIGVPKAAQARLFTKMFRADNAKGLRPDGTGLGLYLVKRVVEDQGGSIIFQSEPGKGSLFGFKLPLSGIPEKTLQESAKIGARVAGGTGKEMPTA